MRDYGLITKQIAGVIESESNLIANLANTVALLKTTYNDWWVGFYLVENNNLVLGPFQGPVACTRIENGKGVCGTSLAQKKTLVVDDVHQFPGHIACSSESNSEIVVPVLRNGEAVAVLDIDSKNFSQFSENDASGLEKICQILAEKWD